MTARRKPHPDPGLGSRIREARKNLGLTQAELGEKLGVHKNVVSHWENETTSPAELSLRLLKELLGIEVKLPERDARGRRATTRRNCPICEKPFPVFYDEKYCSRSCARKGVGQQMMGKNLKGEITINPKGYVQVYAPNHPNRTKLGYVLQHRLVMEGKLGRLLKPYELVHHVNGVRHDNRPENLELCVTKSRSNSHPPGQRFSDLISHLAEAVAGRYNLSRAEVEAVLHEAAA